MHMFKYQCLNEIALNFHYKQNGITFVQLTFCEVELVQFRAMWALSEVKWAQNWIKWALSRVDLEQLLTKWTLSGTQLKRRGRCRGQIWSKIEKVCTVGAKFAPKFDTVGTIVAHRAKWAPSGVDLVQGWIRLEKWPYGVGMVHIFERSVHIVWEWWE